MNQHRFMGLLLTCSLSLVAALVLSCIFPAAHQPESPGKGNIENEKEEDRETGKQQPVIPDEPEPDNKDAAVWILKLKRSLDEGNHADALKALDMLAALGKDAEKEIRLSLDQDSDLRTGIFEAEEDDIRRLPGFHSSLLLAWNQINPTAARDWALKLMDNAPHLWDLELLLFIWPKPAEPEEDNARRSAVLGAVQCVIDEDPLPKRILAELCRLEAGKAAASLETLALKRMGNDRACLLEMLAGLGNDESRDALIRFFNDTAITVEGRETCARILLTSLDQERVAKSFETVLLVAKLENEELQTAVMDEFGRLLSDFPEMDAKRRESLITIAIRILREALDFRSDEPFHENAQNLKTRMEAWMKNNQ